MAMTYACGKTVVDVERVVDVVRSAGAAIMQVYTEDAKVRPHGGCSWPGGRLRDARVVHPLPTSLEANFRWN